MKTKKLHLIAGVALLAFASCSNDMQELGNEQSQALKQIVMTTEDFVPEAGSRTLYEIADGVVSCTWAGNDTVGVFPDEGIQTAFPMASGAGTKNATFDGGGWALKDGSTYAAYYPSIGKYYLDKHAVPVGYAGQTQVGNGSMAHLGAYDYMVAAPIASEFGSAKFMFKHLSALVQLKLTIPESSTLSSIKLVADTEAFAVEGKVDIMAGTQGITAVTLAKEIKLDLQNVITTEVDQVVTFYLMLPPADLSAQTLKAVVTTDKSMLEMALESKNFQAGKVYALKGSIESGEIAGDGSYKDGVVNLTKAGTMKQLFGDDWLDITSLKVVGPIDGDDVRCLRQMLGANIEYGVNTEKGKLSILDLSEASIEGGGGWYYEDNASSHYYTSGNVIGNYMFRACANLQKIVLPVCVTSIGDSSFLGCSSLRSIDIPVSVTSIGKFAFIGCSSLLSIDIPVNVTSIGRNTFENCSSLTSLDIPANVISIGGWAFSGCSSLQSVDIPNGVDLISDGTFLNCSSLRSIDIPFSVTSIGESAFSGCSSLISVTIGEQVTSIGEWAFNACSSLTDFYCYATTPPSLAYDYYYPSFLKYGVKATLHVPARCSAQYRLSDWVTYFQKIVEIK